MTRTHLPSLRLFCAAAIVASGVALVACGGSDSKSKTPGATETAKTATSRAGTTATAGKTGTASGTPQPASSPAAATAAAIATTAAISGATVAPGQPTTAPFPDITVLPDGTATDPQGTPIVIPTEAAPPTVIPPPTPGGNPTAIIVSGATISIDAPAEASGDFEATVRIDGVTKPYIAFNVYVTFDANIVAGLTIKPGAALSESPDSIFCAHAPGTVGAIGLGCTVISGPSAATNGVLATIKFRRIGPGTAQLHLRTVAEGAALTGTFTSTPDPGTQPLPDIVTLRDATVVVS